MSKPKPTPPVRPPAKKLWALRIQPEDIERIRVLARKNDLTMTDYVIQTALGELQSRTVVTERLDDLTERVKRLEHYQGLGA